MLDTTKRKIGVKTEKITISKEIRYCKPLILKGLQKNNKKISTQILTVLIFVHIMKMNLKERRTESTERLKCKALKKFTAESAGSNSPPRILIRSYERKLKLNGGMIYVTKHFR